jgi:hypothetical protein
MVYFGSAKDIVNYFRNKFMRLIYFRAHSEYPKLCDCTTESYESGFFLKSTEKFSKKKENTKIVNYISNLLSINRISNRDPIFVAFLEMLYAFAQNNKSSNISTLFSPTNIKESLNNLYINYGKINDIADYNFLMDSNNTILKYFSKLETSNATPYASIPNSNTSQSNQNKPKLESEHVNYTTVSHLHAPAPAPAPAPDKPSSGTVTYITAEEAKEIIIKKRINDDPQIDGETQEQRIIRIRNEVENIYRLRKEESERHKSGLYAVVPTKAQRVQQAQQQLQQQQQAQRAQQQAQAQQPQAQRAQQQAQAQQPQAQQPQARVISEDRRQIPIFYNIYNNDTNLDNEEKTALQINDERNNTLSLNTKNLCLINTSGRGFKYNILGFKINNNIASIRTNRTDSPMIPLNKVNFYSTTNISKPVKIISCEGETQINF